MKFLLIPHLEELEFLHTALTARFRIKKEQKMPNIADLTPGEVETYYHILTAMHSFSEGNNRFKLEDLQSIVGWELRTRPDSSVAMEAIKNMIEAGFIRRAPGSEDAENTMIRIDSSCIEEVRSRLSRYRMTNSTDVELARQSTHQGRFADYGSYDMEAWIKSLSKEAIDSMRVAAAARTETGAKVDVQRPVADSGLPPAAKNKKSGSQPAARRF
ncbi:hypothetical protein [Streptomyces sp. WAC 01325]|uniref:hypothetical protein n=1 Tax=Streptomyces sp. WAC 01325 TaxID=2203202 RepID=UPI000F88FAEF|nr:hypothetical protein [Streptomyces sp. WAC 01325]